MSGMSAAAYARHARVSRSTVSRWLQDGRIVLGDDGRIDPAVADRVRESTASPAPHHEARREQLAEDRSRRDTQSLQAAPFEAAEKIGLRLKLARMKREEMQAALAEMERDQRARQLILRADVEYLIADLGRTLGNLCDRIADRHTPTLAGCVGDAAAIHAHLVEAMRDLRSEISAQIRRDTENLL